MDRGPVSPTTLHESGVGQRRLTCRCNPLEVGPICQSPPMRPWLDSGGLSGSSVSKGVAGVENMDEIQEGSPADKGQDGISGAAGGSISVLRQPRVVTFSKSADDLSSDLVWAFDTRSNPVTPGGARLQRRFED